MTSPTTKTATQTNEPWKDAVPHLKTILGGGESLYKGGSSTVAPMSAQSKLAASSIGGIANQGNQLLQPTLNTAQSVISSQGISPEITSSIQSLLGTARGDNLNTVNPHLESQLQDQADRTATQLRSIYSAGGRYGSSTMNQDILDRIGQMRGSVLSTNFEKERDRQLSSANSLADIYAGGQNRALQYSALSPTLNNMRYADAEKLGSLGSSLDAYNQRKTDDPWTRLQRYSGLLTGSTAGYGTQTSQTPGPSVLSQILGGVIGLGGAAGSLFSDQRLKTDIRKVGKTDGGSNLYSYRYLGAGPTHIGVMAQQEQKRNPEAVKSVGGLLAVDYSKVA